MVAGTSFGVFTSTNQGTTWIKNDSGIVAEDFYGLAKLSNNKIFAGTSLALFSNNPGDTVWNKSYPKNGFNGQLPVYADNANNLFVFDRTIAHDNSKATPIVKSTNKGNTWNADTAGLSAIDYGLFYIDETGTQHIGTGLYGGSFLCRLWKHAPGGSWALDTVGYPVHNYNAVLSITSDKNGYLYEGDEFSTMRRPIAGGKWLVDTAGLPSFITSLSKMVPDHNGDVIGSNYYHLFRRVHTNNVWTEMMRPPSVGNATITAIAADSSGNIFASFRNSSNLGLGVWYTQDTGTTWILAGLDSIGVKQLIAYGDTVYALTYGRGAYALTVPVCNKPSGLKAKNITSTSATISWKAVPGAAKYKLQYRKQGTTSWTSKTVSSISTTITGLTAASVYEYKVQTYCAADGSFKSSFSAVKTFTTLSPFAESQFTDEQNNAVKIYPNPSHNVFTVEINSSVNGKIIITVNDAVGKKIISQIKTATKGLNQFTFDLSVYPAGIYFVEIRNNDGLVTRKLVKE